MAAQAAPTPPVNRSEQDERSWYLFAASGATSLVIGVLVLAYPDPSVRLLGVFLGIDLVVAGGFLIIRGASALSPEGSGQGELLLGILALIGGVVVIRNPDKSLTLLALVLALYLIVMGALALARALISSERRAASLAKGVVFVAVGTMIVVLPDISRATLTLLGGIALCLVGAADLGEAFIERSRRRRLA